MEPASGLPVISLEQKKTEDTDFEPKYGKYIDNHLTESVGVRADDFKDDMRAMTKLRRQIRSAPADGNGRDLIIQYYCQLDHAELRFPMNEAGIHMSFKWHDSFDEKLTKQHSAAFEKACVLYNLACILTQCATAQPRMTQEGLKQSYNYFQDASSVLKYVSKNFMHAPQLDISLQMLTLTTNVMNAQAQECFFRRSTMDAKTSSLIGKLAKQVSVLYQQALASAAEAKIEPHIPKWWTLLFQVYIPPPPPSLNTLGPYLYERRYK